MLNRKSRPCYVILKTTEILCCLSKENESKTAFWLKFIAVRVISSLVWLGILTHLLINVKYKGPANYSEDLALGMSFATLQMSTMFFTYNSKKWLEVIGRIADFSEFGKPPSFERTQRNCDYFCSIYLVFITTGVSAYGYCRLVESRDCWDLKEERGLYEFCGTMFPLWLPLDDLNHSIVLRLVVIVAQFISVNMMLFTSTSVALLPLNAIELIATLIDHFKTLFNDVFQDENHNKMEQKLKFCIKYHLHILSVAADISYLTKVTIGHLTLISAIAIGCLANQIVKDFSLGALVHLIGFAFGMFVICFAGQRLMDKTLEISDSTYTAKWYLAKPKLIMDVKFMMARSQIPVFVEALPLGVLNFPLYLMILKTSYSYLTLLNEST